MPCFKTFAQGASALAFGCAMLAAPVLADSSNFGPGVASMEVRVTPSGPQVVVRNVAGNHHISSLNLAIQSNTIAVGVGGAVDCKGTVVNGISTRGGYALRGGAYGIGRSSLLMGKALPDPVSIDHISDLDAHSFQLPVATLANPQINVDPVAVVMAAAEQAPNKVQWLRQNHTLTVKIPVRWEAICSYYARNKIKKETSWESIDQNSVSYITKDVDLKIKYEGDPHLFDVNAQIGQGQQPGGFNAGPQPLEITSAQFPHIMPHHEGACPATKQVRVFYQGKGQGQLRFRISAGNKPLQESGVIAYDSKNHVQNHVFELETPKGAAINNTIMQNLRVFVVTKSAGEQTWPNDYQLMDQAVWKVRCTPQVNPALGGGAIGGYKKDGGGGATPAIIRRAQ